MAGAATMQTKAFDASVKEPSVPRIRDNTPQQAPNRVKIVEVEISPSINGVSYDFVWFGIRYRSSLSENILQTAFK